MSSSQSTSDNDASRIKVYLRIRPPKPGDPKKKIPPEIDPSQGTHHLLDVQPDEKTVAVVSTTSASYSNPNDVSSSATEGGSAAASPTSTTTTTTKSFNFDHVWVGSDVDQEVIYKTVTAPVVENIFKGFWGTTMSYGQTGSGKTYSMSCLKPGEEGIVPRAIRQIFDTIKNDCTGRKFTVKFSFLQIYCDRLEDLFNPTTAAAAAQRKNIGSSTKTDREDDEQQQQNDDDEDNDEEKNDKKSQNQQKKKQLPITAAPSSSVASSGSAELRIARDPKKGVIFPGIVEHVVSNEEEFFAKYLEGDKARAVAKTKMNDVSSRGHAALFIQVRSEEGSDDHHNTDNDNEQQQRKLATPSAAEATTGKLFLIDLAGYEKFSSAAIDGGIRKTEARTINESLLSLGNVIQGLAQKSDHIRWRTSKLTRMLEDAIGGRAKCSILLTAGPSSEYLHETLNTLNFGTRAMTIQTKAEVVIERDFEKLSRKLRGMLAAANLRISSLQDEVKTHEEERKEMEMSMQYELIAMKQRQDKQIKKLMMSSTTKSEKEEDIDNQDDDDEKPEKAASLNIQALEEEQQQFSPPIVLSPSSHMNSNNNKHLENEIKQLKQELESQKELAQATEMENLLLDSQLKSARQQLQQLQKQQQEKTHHDAVATKDNIKNMLHDQFSAQHAEIVEPLREELVRYKKMYDDLRNETDKELQAQKDALTVLYEEEISNLKEVAQETQEKLKRSHVIIKKSYQEKVDLLQSATDDLVAQITLLTKENSRLLHQESSLLNFNKKQGTKKSSASSSSTAATTTTTSTKNLHTSSNKNSICFNNKMPLQLTGYISYLVAHYGQGLGRKYSFITTVPDIFFERLRTVLAPFSSCSSSSSSTSSSSVLSMTFSDGCFLVLDQSRLSQKATGQNNNNNNDIHTSPCGSKLLKDTILDINTNKNVSIRGIVKFEDNNLYVACAGRRARRTSVNDKNENSSQKKKSTSTTGSSSVADTSDESSSTTRISECVQSVMTAIHSVISSLCSREFRGVSATLASEVKLVSSSSTSSASSASSSSSVSSSSISSFSLGIKSYVESMGGNQQLVEQQIAALIKNQNNNNTDDTTDIIENALNCLPCELLSSLVTIDGGLKNGSSTTSSSSSSITSSSCSASDACSTISE